MPRISTIIVLLAGIIITGNFLLWPKYQDLTNLQVQVKEKQIELQNKEKYFADLADSAEKLTKFQEELAKIEFALPEKSSLPFLADFLQQISGQSGLILKKLSSPTVSFDKEKTDIKEIRFDMDLSGSYASFKSLLSLLEKSARLIDMENISFSSPEKPTDPFSFSIKIKTQSY